MKPEKMRNTLTANLPAAGCGAVAAGASGGGCAGTGITITAYICRCT